MNRYAIAIWLVLFSCATTSIARAGVVRVSSDSGRLVEVSRTPTRATGEVWTYSHANGVTNQFVTLTNNLAPIPHVAGGTIQTGGWGFPGGRYGPTRTSGSINKAAGTTVAMTNSTTGPPLSDGFVPSAFSSASFSAMNNGQTLLASSAWATALGLSLGQAEDPMFFNAGAVSVTDSLNILSLGSLDGGSAGFEMWMESTIPGLETLYGLAVGIEGAASTLDDVSIAFTSNPALGLDDAAIAQALSDSLSLDAGALGLASPVALGFSIASDEDFALSYGQHSFAQLVPSAGSLSLAGVAGLLLARRRRPQVH